MGSIQPLNEDDLYRTSTQYRLWTFTPSQLLVLRETSHNSTLARASTYLSNSNSSIESQCLTLVESIRLVQRYADQIRSTCTFFNWPINVKSTAVQYLHRIYLSNSVLTYPPKEIYKTVLFLASKTEGMHMALAEYARRIKTAKEDILAPEYIIVQALRFTLDVRGPYRGLRGWLMEVLNWSVGRFVDNDGDATRSEEVKEGLKGLDHPGKDDAVQKGLISQWVTSGTIEDRLQAAYTTARQTLDGPALLTDVWFLYTPPQMYIAALQLADGPLIDYWFKIKFGNNAKEDEEMVNGGVENGSLVEKIRNVVNECARMLNDFQESQVLTKEERAELEKKLDSCRDPSTVDMIGMNARTKAGDVQENEEKSKRKQAERDERLAVDGDVFGPSL